MRNYIIIFFIVLVTNSFSQKVVIDAGHGWGAPVTGGGCSNPDGRLSIEMETAHATSIKLKDIIDTVCSNMQVLLTRPNNTCNSWVSLSQRTTMANSWGADAFLSIHTNGGGGTGTETFWCSHSPSNNTANQGYCNVVQNNMVTYGSWANRRAEDDINYYGYHLYVIRNTNMSAVLNEIGFGDNPSDYTKLASNYWRDQFAEAYFQSLKSYTSITCVPTGPIGGTCTTPIDLTCGTAYNGNTFNGQSTFNNYNCSPSIDEYGIEKVHKFSITQPSTIIASLTNLTVDLDLILLTDSCNPNSCIDRGDYLISSDTLSPGTYYLVVDGYGTTATAQSGSYTLNLNCYPINKGDGSCANPILLSCGEEYRGTNTDGISLINTYDCDTTKPEYGKEKIHKFTLIDTSDISITLTDLVQDLDIQLTSACNGASCIKRHDNIINYDSLVPGTYYIIVDGFGSVTPGESMYTLNLNCNPISGANGTCSKPIPVYCGTTYSGTTSDGLKNFNNYNCAITKNEYGKEKIHYLRIDSLTSVNILLQNLVVDLDIQVLKDSCSPMACIGRADNSLSLDSLTAGDYYIVIDGFGDSITAQSGNYDLIINCAPIVQSHTCHSPIPIDCGVPYNGTTIDGEDRMNIYSCYSFNEFGKEKIHKFSIDSMQNITINLTNTSVNLDLILLADSCNENSCLEWGLNTLQYDSLPAGTYYVVVDGQGTDSSAQSGSYTLTVNCSNLSPASINEITPQLDYEVYPNPTNGLISVKVAKTNEIIALSVLASNGKLIIDNKKFSSECLIDISSFAKGVYFLKLNTENNTATTKIVLK